MIHVQFLGKDMWRRYPAMENKMAVSGIAKVEIRLSTNMLCRKWADKIIDFVLTMRA